MCYSKGIRKMERNREKSQGGSVANSSKKPINPGGIYLAKKQDPFLPRTREVFFLLFWIHETDKFIYYYVNFQLPYTRSHCGFDTLDLDLDIVIDEQFAWKWKDVDEYQAGINEGGITDEWVRGIEQSKNEVLERIRKHSHPMDGHWLQWCPDKKWKPPKLPDDWKIL